MKKLVFGLIATVVLGFAGNAQSEQNYDVVSDLFKKSLNLWSSKDYMSFFDPEIIILIENNKMTEDEAQKYKDLYLKGLEQMKVTDKSYAEAYEKVENLKLSSDDLKIYVTKFLNENPLITLDYNKALIPNKKACLNSAVAFIEHCNVISSWGCPAIIGVYIHC